MDDESRLDQIERDLAALAQRVALLERPAAVSVPERPAAAAVWGAPTPSAAARPRIDWEALVGGRLLALAGGSAVVVGVGLLVAFVAERGWLGETARVGLALAGSLVLVGAGVWLHERRGRTQASLAAVGAGIASLYLTLTAATALYRLLPAAPALTLALLVGALATVIAVRWDATAIAGLGILGALAAPVLVDAPSSRWTLAFLLVAHAAAVTVLVWRAWGWLALGAFGIVMSQVAFWIIGGPVTSQVVVVLALFGALNLTAVVGFALGHPGAELRRASVLLGAANAAVLGGLGWASLGQSDGGRWLAALAAGHGVLGLLALTRRHVSRDVARLLCALGVLLGDVAFTLLADGPVLPVGWAASAVLLAEVGRRSPRDAPLARTGLSIQFALAGAHVLLLEAPPSALLDGVVDLPAAALALSAIALAAWRARCRALAAAAAVYLASVVIVTELGGQQAQVLVSSVWSACGVAALWLGLRRDDRGWRRGGFLLLALATLKVALHDLAALEQGYRSLSTIALGLLLLTGAYAYQRLRSTLG